MWLLILGQKSHLPEEVSPSAPTSYGTAQLSPALTWLLQHYGSWSQDEKLAHRTGKPNHCITFSNRYHCATFKWVCLEYMGWNIAFPYVFRYISLSFQAFFTVSIFHGNKQIFFSGLQCTCTKQKIQSSAANRFFKIKQQSDLKTTLNSK